MQMIILKIVTVKMNDATSFLKGPLQDDDLNIVHFIELYIVFDLFAWEFIKEGF
jgi:hypothetical protein